MNSFASVNFSERKGNDSVTKSEIELNEHVEGERRGAWNMLYAASDAKSSIYPP
jgi:hypothetical protein